MNTAFETYMRELNRYRSENPQLREGEAAWLVLWSLHPDLAAEVDGTSLDPYHYDARVEVFLRHVADKLRSAA